MENGINSKTEENQIVKLNFELSFHLPISGEKTSVHIMPDFATFKYRFVHEIKQTGDELNPEVTTTTIMMEYIYQRELLSERSEIASGAFMNCLIFMNNYIDAYRLANNVPYIKNFNLLDLPPVITISTEKEEYAYMLPQFSTIGSTEGSMDMATAAVEKFVTWRMHRPLEIIDRFHSKAIHHFYTEEFVFAIVELQTSFESYIRLCQHIILDSQGIAENEIEIKLNMPLRNTIEHLISKGLKENLGFDTNPIISKWFNTLYKLRNQIVHNGMSYILGDQAYEAYDAYQDCINYLSDLMVREKLIPEDKMIRIANLNKNIKENHNEQATIDKLKERGFFAFLADYNDSEQSSD
ncbi:HEPN domain-containing protein [Pedobacter aquatilis]|uniref:HEPN domain-containing protein n=1 Tax=Pedobacter aquatilis TaxID=351343 RepID=UPI0029318780|nr:HEPN domain-containing protein [Pedobacter aquatilis]